MKKVRLLSLIINKFGIFRALELDFNKFKQSGIIAIKGNAGAGKSTIQNSLKTTIQGQKTLNDQEKYGDEWETEVQLADGDRKIFISAKKTKKGAPKYSLFEKDENGKKIQSPAIDGIKATPVAYMEEIATELTFGIKRFLSDNPTEHKKFMFELFRPELKKQGVIFDKDHPDYESSILGQLDSATADRDTKRAICTHNGAFIADFERDGIDIDFLETLEYVNLDPLFNKKKQIEIEIAKGESAIELKIEQQKSRLTGKAQKITDQIREISENLTQAYTKEKEKYDIRIKDSENDKNNIIEMVKLAKNVKCFPDDVVVKFEAAMNTHFEKWYKNLPDEPIPPVCPKIENGKVSFDFSGLEKIKFHSDFDGLEEKLSDIRKEYSSLLEQAETPFDSKDLKSKLKTIDSDIEKNTKSNRLFERFKLNREWIDAKGLVDLKREQLAKLYASINTGVPGLYMKPFFDDKGKMEIKTVYTGVYDYSFFKPNSQEINQEKDLSKKETLIKENHEREQLLSSYSSTQMPIIGILLQVARLKKRPKILPYIFLDDVPMDSHSRGIISRIAEENKLTIITSLTGDFDKAKLTDDELLVEGGEVFFNE